MIPYKSWDGKGKEGEGRKSVGDKEGEEGREKRREREKEGEDVSYSTTPLGSPDRAYLCVQCGIPVCVFVRTEQTGGKFLPYSYCVACISQTALPGRSLAQGICGAGPWGGRQCRSWRPG